MAMRHPKSIVLSGALSALVVMTVSFFPFKTSQKISFILPFCSSIHNI